MEIMQIGPFAARIMTMTMGANASRTNAGPALRRLSVPAIVPQPERWSKTKRNSTTFHFAFK